MTERDEKILRAAKAVFSKYGVAKTTMSDIAAEAGVARQTVYNAFPGKPEILRGTTRLMMDDFRLALLDAWTGAECVADKVDVYFEMGPVNWYQTIASSPEIAELFEGINEHASIEVRRAAETWISLFSEMFEQGNLAPKDTDVSLQDVAEFLYFASLNAKHSVQSADALRARLKTIKSALLNMLDEQSLSAIQPKLTGT
ncbi:MAG: TetR/AcrR family transcriptional regulator [Rhodobacteraceae bacterium]|nr:TetR/AcrR family transcriptional regulator [Paracoccaceae bacterium]